MGFGGFDTICRKSALPMCSVVGPTNPISNGRTGIQATCYARSVELANTIIFEAATDFIHILALGMAAIMVLHVRSKFTAVGEPIRPKLCPYDRMCSDKCCSKYRSQRNHHILLHLHGFDHDLIDTGRWSHTTGVRDLSLLRRRPKWLHFCSVHLPPNQRLCRFSAIRRWNKAVRVATSRFFNWDVCHLGRSINLDIQGKSWIKPNQHRWRLRGTIPDQRHIPLDLLGHADNPCHKYPARSLATRRHLLWGFLLRYWSGDPLRVQ